MEQKRTKLAKQAEHLRVVNQEWNIYRDQVKDAKASIAEDQDDLGKHQPCSRAGLMHYSKTQDGFIYAGSVRRTTNGYTSRVT